MLSNLDIIWFLFEGGWKSTKSTLYALFKTTFSWRRIVRRFLFSSFSQSGVLSPRVCFKVSTLIIFYLCLIQHGLLLLFLLCTEKRNRGVYLVLITKSYLQSFGDQRDLQHDITVSCRRRHSSRTAGPACALSHGQNWCTAKIASGNINAGCKGIYWRGCLFINQLTLVKQNSPRRKNIGGVAITDV